MDSFTNLDGNFFENSYPLLFTGNRSFRYGDGLFETMKIIAGTIQLEKYHFERLFAGMKTLELDIPVFFSAGYLSDQVRQLAVRNGREASSRVRLTIFRDEVQASLPHFLIETGSLPPPDVSGLKTCIYTADKKSTGILSNLKTCNYLLYAMVASHAKKNQFDECFVLNQYDRICDSSISNVFSIKNGIVYTPPLSEGCIAGVMRRHLLQLLPACGFQIEEKPTTPEWLLQADELFLTNAIRGIRSVASFETKEYGDELTVQIRHQLCRHSSS